MPWIYKQATGELTLDGKLVGVGYSGHGIGVNNGVLQDVVDVGPIPVGSYMIGVAVDHPKLGPLALPLTPNDPNSTFGRDDFWIHGENPSHIGQSSEGCIIQANATRTAISASDVTQLQVVA